MATNSPKQKRPFRTLASHRAEKVTRNLIKPFLESRGFVAVEDQRKGPPQAQEQTLFATAPDGSKVGLSVRLCWRRKPGKKESETVYSAAQLMARIPKGKTWEQALKEKIERKKLVAATHLLFVQPNRSRIVAAALVPVDQVVPIWILQRDESQRLIDANLLGRQTKNHAMNGASPTFWLKSDKAPSVAQCLWDSKGVVDLVKAAHLTPSSAPTASPDDTFDDLPGVDSSLLGTDTPSRHRTSSSGVRRDPKVRQEVLRLSKNRCEWPGCGASRAYKGFLDVHHVLGAATSDRVYNCVALCPNCHREAHFSPDIEAINAKLLTIAQTHRRRR